MTVRSPGPHKTLDGRRERAIRRFRLAVQRFDREAELFKCEGQLALNDGVQKHELEEISREESA